MIELPTFDENDNPRPSHVFKAMTEIVHILMLGGKFKLGDDVYFLNPKGSICRELQNHPKGYVVDDDGFQTIINLAIQATTTDRIVGLRRDDLNEQSLIWKLSDYIRMAKNERLS